MGEPFSLKVDRLIRSPLSRPVTWLSRSLGFADRPSLVTGLRDLSIDPGNEGLALDALRDTGILIGKYRPVVANINDVEPYMISASVSRARLGTSNLPGLMEGDLFAQRSQFQQRLSQGISRGIDTAGYFLGRARDYAGTGISLLLGTGAASGILHSLSDHKIGLGIAALTGLGALGKFSADRLIAGSRGQRVAKFFSNVVLPLSILGAGGYAGYSLYESNASLGGVLEQLGLSGTLGLGSGLLWLLHRYSRNNLAALEDNYGAKLNPGQPMNEKIQMAMATNSVMSDSVYLAVRTLLFTVAAAYLGQNVAADPEAIKLALFSMPALGLGTGIALSRSEYLENMLLDIGIKPGAIKALKCYSALWGAELGILGSLALSLITKDWGFSLSFATFWGSLASLTLNEFHGIGHSINTNLGFIDALKASSRDLMGQVQSRCLAGDAKVLIMNPQTGTNEHTLGALFSTLLSRKPGLRFMVHADRIPSESISRRSDIELDRTFIQWLDGIRDNIHGMLINNIDDSTPLRDRYVRLIDNLNCVADHFENALPELIADQMNDNPGMFETRHTEEYRRACFEELGIRAIDFRRDAARLQAKLNRGEISQEDFYREWSWQLGCYDPDYVTVTLVARKALRGDELEVRKVENVAASPFFRGMTVFKLREFEFEDQLHPTEDFVSATWTRIENPEFRYGARAGTLAGSKYIWIPSNQVLTGLQERHRDCLSTSPIVENIDNDPAGQAGFAQGTSRLPVTINGNHVVLDNYYIVTDADQSSIPAARQVIYRDGSSLDLATLDNYGLIIGGRTGAETSCVDPTQFVVPLFDFWLMMDKNDVQLTSYSVEPAILEREAQRMFAQIIFRYPVGRDTSIENPYNNGVPIADISVEHGNLELSYEGQVIPYKLDRSSAHIGQRGSGNITNWKDLNGARVTMQNGRVTGFELIYGQNAVQIETPSKYPFNISSLNLPADGTFELGADNFVGVSEGDMSWVRITYQDGAIRYVRVKHRPNIVRIGEN